MGCEYTLDNEFIYRLKIMGQNSDIIISKILSKEFFDLLEEYYYSFENEVKNNDSTINSSFINNNDEFLYLKNSKISNFNFSRIKDIITFYTIYDIYLYAKNKTNNFLKDFNDFLLIYFHLINVKQEIIIIKLLLQLII